MDYRQLCRFIGLLLLLMAVSMAGCLAYAVYDQEPRFAADRALGLSALITAAAGGLLRWFGRGSSLEILRREAIAIVGLGWTLSTLFGALPYMLSTPSLAPAAAIFESASGFTTTGASAIADVEVWPRGLLLWRATTQWLGGMGILVLFVAVLSMAGGGGSKSLFRRESSGKLGEGFAARMRDTAIRLWQIYLGLSAACFAGLLVLGMPVFDAVCHTFATISTGGFSTKNASIGYYKSAAIDWWIILFMLLGAISFMLYAWLLARRWSRWKQDEETRFYLVLLAVVTAAVTGSLLYNAQAPDFATALRNAAFQVVSISTTTGFVTSDYDRWSDFTRILIVAVMFVGGCAGSTAGGIKVSRLLVFFKNFHRQMIHTFRPNQIVPVRINGVPLTDSYLAEVGFFLALVGFIVALGSLAMATLEPSFDLVSSFGAVIATLFNTGPGLGAVGPVCTYADLGAASHLLLSLLMIMGRLEILAMLALFIPALWRKY
jgi:trk system potassium uptake protein TrkH